MCGGNTEKYNFKLGRAEKEATLFSELICFQAYRLWDFLDVPIRKKKTPTDLGRNYKVTSFDISKYTPASRRTSL